MLICCNLKKGNEYRILLFHKIQNKYIKIMGTLKEIDEKNNILKLDVNIPLSTINEYNMTKKDVKEQSGEQDIPVKSIFALNEMKEISFKELKKKLGDKPLIAGDIWEA